MSAKSRIRCDLDLDDRTPGRRLGRLSIPHSRHESGYGVIPVPIAVLNGGEGPSVLLTAGNHGDEYEGQAVLRDLIRELDPTRLKGRLIVLPALNLPAVLAGRRDSPLDGGNLNRLFPGDPNGGPTSMIAHFVDTELLPRVSWALDFHSGGSSMEYLPCAMVRAANDPALAVTLKAAMLAMRLPLGLTVQATQDTRTLPAAGLARGVAHVACEIGGGGSLTPSSAAAAEGALYGLLCHAGVLELDTPSAPPPRLMNVAGADHFLFATARGLFVPEVALGQTVTAGQRAGRILSIEEPERPPIALHFARAGLVVCRRVPAQVAPGDCVAHVATDAGT
ncbi:succinylglutamate desuccinylase/aspartoacylase family protein [Elioraea sp.]|uniref:succinylglutamate desuccinylase/aspartoacylase family protein n=1 Tax=Elioraea sp. TaxID=2185103 RepID=UPI003F720BC5